MVSAVLDCIIGENGNYVLPFFWQHGEEEAVLRKYVNVIHDVNIKEMCLEARPHPDYAGEGWFHDVDIILDEAKKLDMKLWILDDAHFPSGQAAGKMAEADARLCKQYLNYACFDATGPKKQVSLDVEKAAKHYDSPFAAPNIFGGGEKRKFDDDELFAVIASRLDGKEDDIYHLDDSLIDLTDMVKDGKLSWDVPGGVWRIFVIYSTHNGGGRGGYVNFLSKESCRMQINACYEPHFEHFRDEFGKTILGFFSDEPEIGNVPGYSGADAAIGNMNMPLPWSEEMPSEMKERFGDDYRRIIPALWMNVGSGEFTADIRVGFMDIVTRLCRKNFGEQLGEWCRDHGVKYIGHVVEDNDNSTKLGSSQGHYFRALWGQDWAGIDNIGGQVTEGGADISHKGLLGLGADGEFYHHMLGRLGTSLADLDPKKQGNTMCEIFGAYGWQEGTRLMKYELDHFLVRGVNHFVPHAFSPKDFPDFDCPPHFYAHGKNPLYKPFGELMAYTNRVSHLISGGKHTAEVAVLYHAETEWSGLRYMDAVKVARKLDEAQIDFDVIPADALIFDGEYDPQLDREGLHINGHTFKTLVIPGAEYFPESVIDFLYKAEENSFSVLIAGFAPSDVYGCAKGPDIAGKESEDRIVSVVELSDIADRIIEHGLCNAQIVEDRFSDLRIYHYERGKEKIFLISNESIYETFDGKVRIPAVGIPYVYDAMKNRILTVGYEYTKDNCSTEIPMALHPYEMRIIVISENDSELKPFAITLPECKKAGREVNGIWKVSFTDNENYPDFKDEIQMTELRNILEVKPDFSGIIRYETEFEGRSADDYLKLEDAFESAEVWINDEYAGSALCPPYIFEVDGMVKDGTNHLRIEVRTTLDRLVNKITGGAGFLGPDIKVVEPSGIIGEVMLE